MSYRISYKERTTFDQRAAEAERIKERYPDRVPVIVEGAIPNLDKNDIGVEILIGNKTNGDVEKIRFNQELTLMDFKNGKATYTCNFPLKHAGVHDYAFRIFPKHPDLKYRMDFPLIKWV